MHALGVPVPMEFMKLASQSWHFLSTNATSMLRSIVSSYPGALVLVSIQKSLVEAIADRLVIGGKVFLQSDMEAVALRMKKEFVEHGKGKLALVNHDEEKTDQGQWLKENPFGGLSDWERHVLELVAIPCTDFYP